MKGRLFDSIALCVVFASVGAGCATATAPDFHGRWRPVNRYPDVPQAIPIAPAYVFEASPMDGTLRNMLGRWARDSKMALSYLPPMDYTLHRPVANIHTTDLRQALQMVSDAYAAQDVVVESGDGRIIAKAGPSRTAAPPVKRTGE